MRGTARLMGPGILLGRRQRELNRLLSTESRRTVLFGFVLLDPRCLPVGKDLLE